MFKKKLEPLHNVQIIAIFLFLTTMVTVLFVVLFQSLFRVPETHSQKPFQKSRIETQKVCFGSKLPSLRWLLKSRGVFKTVLSRTRKPFIAQNSNGVWLSSEKSLMPGAQSVLKSWHQM